MRQVTVHIVGITPYSQSRQHDEPELPKEDKKAWELRTWREKCTYDENGIIEIPGMAFKQALAIGCKRLGDQIPGKGKATYTKFFEGDVICEGNASLGVHKDDVESVTINANSDGVRGSGKRVKRTFPVIPAPWRTSARFTIFDDTITPEVFERVFAAAGMSVGVGRFRPEKGGLNGRFKAERFDWE
jgi:hypothetical protein